jgi:drug/metabolite transporter (DMT)-like permease
MNREWMPQAAGTLTIVNGLSALFWAVIFGIPYVRNWDGEFDFFLVVAVFLIVFGVLALISGGFALRKERWWLALSGAVTGLIGDTLVMLLFLALIALSCAAYIDSMTMLIFVSLLVMVAVFGIGPLAMILLSKRQFWRRKISEPESASEYC